MSTYPPTLIHLSHTFTSELKPKSSDCCSNLVISETSATQLCTALLNKQFHRKQKKFLYEDPLHWVLLPTKRRTAEKPVSKHDAHARLPPRLSWIWTVLTRTHARAFYFHLWPIYWLSLVHLEGKRGWVNPTASQDTSVVQPVAQSLDRLSYPAFTDIHMKPINTLCRGKVQSSEYYSRWYSYLSLCSCVSAIIMNLSSHISAAITLSTLLCLWNMAGSIP
jgi:hypothetical protein